jgi:hypothetical protein
MTAHPAVTNHAPMRGSKRRDRGIRADTAAEPTPAPVLRVVDTYLAWRQTTDAVADTYERWSAAPATEEAARFAAYTAALDQAETAAAAYAEWFGVLERRRPDSN